jgi:hypothetical protein
MNEASFGTAGCGDVSLKRIASGFLLTVRTGTGREAVVGFGYREMRQLRRIVNDLLGDQAENCHDG